MTPDATNATLIRLGSRSKEKSISAGCAPSTCRDRCPAEVLTRVSPPWLTFGASLISGYIDVAQSILAHESAPDNLEVRLQKECPGFRPKRVLSRLQSPRCRHRTSAESPTRRPRAGCFAPRPARRRVP